MRVLEVRCQSCAAPLEVPPKVTNVTCTFCGTPLSVQRQGGVAFTEALEDISETLEEIQASQERIERRQRVDSLDRDWDREQQRYLVRRKDGQTSIPTVAGSLGMMVAFGLFGVFLVGSFGRTPLGPIGLFPIGMGLLFGFLNLSKAKSYEQARDRYRQRRRELMRG